MLYINKNYPLKKFIQSYQVFLTLVFI